MGKSAANERLKLRATFYNNIAVGLVITGIAAPYFATASRNNERNWPPDIGAWERITAIFSEPSTQLAVGIMAVSFAAALQFRRAAERAIVKIED